MRTPRLLATLVALALPVVAVAAPAEADRSYTGTVDVTDPPSSISEPQWEGPAQGCPLPGADTASSPVDTIGYVADSTGLRTITATVAPDRVTDLAVYLFRNGTCVAADYGPDDDAEMAAGRIDITGIPFNNGDAVKVVLGGFEPPIAYSLSISEPPTGGVATGATRGSAKKLVKLPARRDCDRGQAVVKVTRSAKVKADRLVFKANGKKLKTVRKVKAGKLKLKKVPPASTKLIVIAKLKSGKTAKASRSYRPC